MEVLDVAEVVVEGALRRAEPRAHVGDRDGLDAALGEEVLAGLEVVLGGHRRPWLGPSPYSRVRSMAVRGLAVDLDGTLLRPDDSISARDRAAVAAAVDAGWSVVLATARWYQLAERTARSLGLVDPVIACSGAEVRRLRRRRRPPRRPAAGAVHRRAVRGVRAARGDGDGLRGPSTSPCGRRGRRPRLPEMRRVVVARGRRADAAWRARLRRGAQPAWCSTSWRSDWADDVRFLVSMTGRGVGVLTDHRAAVPTRVGRWPMACADLGIDPRTSLRFGDSETDVEMFQVAGASVAMGQAAAAVQDAATWVTATNIGRRRRCGRSSSCSSAACVSVDGSASAGDPG